MKFLLLVFLVGCATANIHEALEEEAEYTYQEFMLGLEHSGALKDALGYDFLQQAEDDIKTEMGKKLRETLNDMLEKMKEAIDNGKSVSEDMQKKLKEVREKMKEMRIEIGEKAKELMGKLRDKVRDFMKDLFDKFKGDKRSVGEEEFLDFNMKEMFQKLKKALLDKIDKEKLKAKVEELFGKGSEMADSLLDIINEKSGKYKQKLLDLVDRYLGKKEQEKRSLREYWEKIKEYFKNLQLEIKEKYMKFGEWVKDNVKIGMDKGKTRLDNIKSIAKEFIDHAKNVSKEVAVEAEEFLRPYKEDLGSLYDQVKVTVRDIIKNRG